MWLAPHLAARDLLGALKVATDPPGARVYVNGQFRGVSPCTLGALGVGLIEVKAEAQGYEAATETVEIEGRETVELELKLKRLANVGALDVRVTPDDSLVELDRLPAGRTPALLLNVPAGTHRVQVSADGYRSLLLTVAVAPDERRVIDGRLTPLEEPDAGGAPDDLGSPGRLDPEEIPPLSEMSEERAFEPVRTRLRTRDYDGALSALDAIAADPGTQQYALRVGRDRRIIRRVREVVEAGYSELARAEGQDYVLLLRGGIRLAGRLVDVSDERAVVAQQGGERRIDLEAISADQIVRLASASMPPEEPSNLVSFGLLHAVEGEFEESYEYLRRAAEAGSTVASARSYVDSERLWAAAVEKDRVERRTRAAARTGPAFPPLRDAGPVPFLIDTYRGRTPPEEFRDLLVHAGAPVRTLAGTFGPEYAEEPGVLVIFDQGGATPVPRYDRQELQSLLDFVQHGGALLFVGARRPVRQDPNAPPERLLPHPYDHLLRWYGIQVRRDRTELADDLPEGYPRGRVVGVPSSLHPVAIGARSFVVPVGSPTLDVQTPAWVAFRATALVKSTPIGAPAPVLVAGRSVGQGRVVVLSHWPVPAAGSRPDGPFLPDDSMQVVANALAWLAQAAREAGVKSR